MDFYHTVGYFTGLFFIKPDMEPAALFRTAALVHFLDAILCAVVASHSGRRKSLWMIGGLVLGIWALATLFLLPDKRHPN
ncbi:MAG: hypothetical protein ACM37Z_20655 [Deltaproteobacteria bacterium]